MTARVVVCGVGALGSTAVHYCRNLDIELRLVDFDRVESKNLAAQWFVKQSVGKNKAEAIRLQLANFYGAKAEAFGVRLAATNAAQLPDHAFDNFVIDRLDGPDGAQRIYLRPKVPFGRCAPSPVILVLAATPLGAGRA